MYMKTYHTPEVITQAYMTTCGGCGHGLLTKIVAELIDELHLADSMIMVFPIGCSTNAWEYFKTDSLCALHGRAPAVATGIKRSRRKIQCWFIREMETWFQKACQRLCMPLSAEKRSV